MKKRDITGKKFGKLTVLEPTATHIKPSGQTTSMWKCICDCGKETVVSLSELTSGGTKSCGCLKNKKENLINQQFGLWTVIKPSETNPRKWVCKCKCGTEKEIRTDNLKTFNEKSSCGCNRSELLKEQYKNGRKSALHNLIGKRFGRLLVIRRSEMKSKRTLWVCQCDCGTQKEIDASKLVTGKTISCGCYAKEVATKARLIDITGKKFGEWTVLHRSANKTYKTGQAAPMWKCKCSCGTEKDVFGASLRKGETRSCGCLDISRGEELVQNVLTNNKIKFKREYSFDDLFSLSGHLLRFDFCIFDNNLNIQALIEYQGEQHYVDMGEYGKNQREITDLLKKKYCQTHNLKLYEVKYDSDAQMETMKILKEIGLIQDNSVSSSKEKM